MSLQQFKDILQQNGIVGAGGAGFPSYAKLAQGADTLVLNCAECEPLLYTDYMLMRESMHRIVQVLCLNRPPLSESLSSVRWSPDSV